MNCSDRYAPRCPQGGIQGAGLESEIESESAHRGSKDVMGAARQEEGLAHFRVAVLCAR